MVDGFVRVLFYLLYTLTSSSTHLSTTFLSSIQMDVNIKLYKVKPEWTSNNKNTITPRIQCFRALQWLFRVIAEKYTTSLTHTHTHITDNHYIHISVYQLLTAPRATFSLPLLSCSYFLIAGLFHRSDLRLRSTSELWFSSGLRIQGEVRSAWRTPTWNLKPHLIDSREVNILFQWMFRFR